MNSTIPNSENPKPHGADTHMRRLRAACIVAATALLLAPGLRAQTDAASPAPAAKENPKPKTQAVRQKFVPAPADPSRGNGADCTALHHLTDDDPDVLMLMAHAGVGDSFPVQEEGKAKEFDVKITSGDDDKLAIEVIWDKGTNPELAASGMFSRFALMALVEPQSERVKSSRLHRRLSRPFRSMHFHIMLHITDVYRTVRKVKRRTSITTAKLQELCFQFSDFAAVCDEPFNVGFPFFVGLIELCLCAPEQFLFHSVGDFQVHDFAPEIVDFVRS